ncbi:UNVERIFIED_CONTAM: hypothetical protein K2H54_031987 [Gekko kuhli]
MGVLWFPLRKISECTCPIQLFIIYSFSFMESAVPFAMVLDHFLAIFYPSAIGGDLSGMCSALSSLIVILLTLGSDLLFLLISYSLILKTILGIIFGDKGHHKALGTCVSHRCAILIFYVPVLGLSVMYWFGHHASPLLHVVMGNIYILLSPLMNPVIYSIKTKQIYSRILRTVSFKGV